MQRQSSDLIAVTLVAVLSAALILITTTIPILRLVCALPLVLVLPGYAITAACFPTRSLGLAERLLFSLGLSLVVTALAGLALNGSPWGLQAGSWTCVLLGIVVGASAIAWWRRKRNVSAAIASADGHFKLNFHAGLLLGLSVLVTGAAVGLAKIPAPPNNVSGYTLLWMIPAGDGNANDFRLGVTSDEFATTTYHLQVMAGGRLIFEQPKLQLAPGAAWTTRIGLPSDPASSGSVEAVLYRLDNPSVVYRHVKLQRGE